MSSLTVEITEVEAGASSSFWITIPGPEGSALVVSRKMHKVPPHMRLKNQTSNLYDPVIVSYGPYHHGKDHLRQAEDLKGQALDLLFSETGKDKAFFMIYILRRINHIRDCYVGVPVDVYDETKLAEMMLADACLILYIHDAMDGNDEFFDMGYRCLGFAGMRLVVRDLYLLENQIPYWIVQFLDSFRRRRCPSVLTSPLQEPVHLLAILHLTLFERRQNLEVRQPKPEFKLISWLRWRSRNQKESTTGDNLENISYPHRSVMDLKAKGFRFESSSDLLTDIKFESYCFHGKLQIPSRHITDHFKYFYSNMIAFEVSPAAYTGFAVASYVNFMKSFIESPDDVKELQEKGIFRTTFSNEEVVQMFKEMDTYGLDKRDAFLEVKMRIEKHCSNKAKTWMAELLHTYFRSPWTVLALFAAIVALCLASLQGYYAIRRDNKSSS